MSIFNFWKMKKRMWVEEDMSLPYEFIANGCMDRGIVHMDSFYNNTKNSL